MKLCNSHIAMILIMVFSGVALTGCAQNAGLPIGWNPGDPDSTNPSGTPGKQKSPAQLQLEVMDFSDRFVSATWSALEEMLAAETDPARRVAILTWKVRYASAAMEIGSGADPRTSLLDMAIFITAGNWALERYWIPETFGPEGARLRPVYANLEERIWQIVSAKLTREQTQLLRDLITQWIRENPPSYEISGIRFRNLEGVVAEDFRSPRDARGLLASVRSWLGEVNTSLLFGERVLFYLERTPRLLAQQTDLTLAQIADDFPITRVEPDFPALATYVETLPTRMLEEFTASLPWDETSLPFAVPDFQNLQSTLGDTRSLVAESTTLVSAGTDLVNSASGLSEQVHTLLLQVDALGGRLEASGALSQDWEPKLAEVAASLASLERTVVSLQLILATDEEGLTPASRLLEETEIQVNAAVDRIFLRALWLLGIVFLIGCSWIVLARMLRTKNREEIKTHQS
jgi:hypothetical protein